jgi:hypothetical protein
MPVATGAVKEPLPTQDRAISQIQPEVLPQVTPGTFPTTGKSSENSQNSGSIIKKPDTQEKSTSNWPGITEPPPKKIIITPPKTAVPLSVLCASQIRPTSPSTFNGFYFRKLAHDMKDWREVIFSIPISSTVLEQVANIEDLTRTDKILKH